MDIINAFGFQLIPGFLALFLFLFGYFKPAECGRVKTGRCRSTGSKYALNSTLKPVKK
jgi:hypothetical protein